MVVEDALRLLNEVYSVVEGFLPGLVDTPRSLEKARAVSGVFKEYAVRLRALGLKQDGSGLTNTERGFVRQIARGTENALHSLHSVEGGDSSVALDRALVSGESVEANLRALDDSVNAASSRSALPHVDETYHPGTNIPPLPDNLYLEFDSRDAQGRFSAPEGELRSTVLSSTSRNHVIIARGAARSSTVLGASGMAGVGKTTALVALGHDPAVRAHFRDGILFMKLGAAASVESITRGLSKIMKFTGARASAASVRNQTDLTEAVEDAAIWFQGRCNLFLIDDIWPTKSSSQGYFSVLRNILEGSPDSRIALSTRSRLIGSSIGSCVNFGAREPCGFISTSIFMSYAAAGLQTEVGDLEENIGAVQGILNLCAGLPIALEVTGRGVASRVSLGLDFEYACNTFLRDLQKEVNFGSSILNAAINLSLKYLNSELHKLSKTSKFRAKYSMYEMYSSLCVLEKQQRIPVTVLAPMWGMDDEFAERITLLFSSMSLGSASTQKNDTGKKEVGLNLHDLHLDFCRQQVYGEPKLEKWHFRLLQGHMPLLVDSKCEATDVRMRLSEVVQHQPQNWLHANLRNKNYILHTLTRHLLGAGLFFELWAVVLDPKWMHAQVKASTGGISALKRDFNVLETSLETNSATGVHNVDILLSLRTIFRCVQATSFVSLESVHALSFSVLSRSYAASRQDSFLSLMQSKISSSTPTPCLAPVISFFEADVKALEAEVNVVTSPGGEKFRNTVDYSPCGQYIVASANRNVAVLSSETGSMVKELKHHKDVISAVKFHSSSTIISASRDNIIAVWDWKLSETPQVIMRGRSDNFLDILLSCGERKLYSFSHDRTVKVWDMTGGEALETFRETETVKCMSAYGERVAIGLASGQLRVLQWGSKELLFETNCQPAAVAFSANGEYLAFTCDRNRVEVWKTDTWTPVVQRPRRRGHGALCIALSPDSKLVATGDHEGNVIVCNIVSGEVLGSIRVSFQEVDSISFSPDGEHIVSGSQDGIVRIWCVKMIEHTLQGPWVKGRSAVRSFALSGDGKRALVQTGDSKISMWNALTGNLVSECHPWKTQLYAYARRRADINPSLSRLDNLAMTRIYCIALDHEGEQAALGFKNGNMTVWRTEPLFQLKGYWERPKSKMGHFEDTQASFSRDGTKIVFVTANCIRVWDTETDRIVCCIEDPLYSGTHNVALSSDGQLIIHTDKRKITKVWKANTEELLFRHFDSEAHILLSANPLQRHYWYKKSHVEGWIVDALSGCGSKSSSMWPKSFSRLSGDVLMFGKSVFYMEGSSRRTCKSKRLAFFPSSAKEQLIDVAARWEFSPLQGTFVTSVEGVLVICRLLK